MAMDELDLPVRFLHPHPGFGGAIIPIPGQVKTIADALDGRIDTLRNALERLRAVTHGVVEAHLFSRDIELTIGPHHFQVIRFRPTRLGEFTKRGEKIIER